MDLRDLRYFETIAELQHMGRASTKLHRTQQALSSCVRRLEADCGATLFEKSGRGIQLTDAGKVMQRWAQRFRHDAEAARQELSAIGKGLSGHVRIGIVPTAAQFLLPAVAEQLLIEAPGVTLRTTVALLDTLQPLLRSGEIDLMVGTASAIDERFTHTVIAEDAIVVAVSAKHELLSGSPTMKDLVGYRWALQPPGAPTRDWLDHAFDRKRLPRPRVQVESTMLLMLPTLIERTGLLSFISRHHLQARGGRTMLKEVPIREATMIRRLVVSHRASAYLSPAASRVVELFSAAHLDH